MMQRTIIECVLVNNNIRNSSIKCLFTKSGGFIQCRLMHLTSTIREGLSNSLTDGLKRLLKVMQLIF
jgi:hypothetical protein